ncbi:hypothetical protein KHS38_06210 [Mucilaginibacter sp. Bleaf8]|uniref:hypothetical protein n=1 Tax=Mucilaginibacter sp. Bleaf8 TaxID=2834430 RepID=UPI001BCAD994|nr:hypothetical protein [Mucilaginibacter sp. Bleaf8]MBS7563993.1 hypothetical protein [Mucilaginibacter sp. Bleaf8]
MKYLITLLTAFIIMTTGFAQGVDYTGSYNGSKPEMVMQTLLMPDHSFVIAMSYGAVDQLITGKWKQQVKGIYLEEDAPVAHTPFLVYQGHGNGADGELTFQNFEQNNPVAFRVLDSFQADSMKYLHLPGQTTFSHSSTLTLPANKLKTFFISQQVGENQHEVYEYTLAPGCNRVLLFYSSNNKQLFKGFAELKGGALYIKNDGEEQLIGRKEPLPQNYKQMMARVQSDKQIPETLNRTQDDGNVAYHLLQPRRKFASKLNIKSDQAYFGHPQADQQAEPQVDTIEPMVPVTSPPLIKP